MLTLENLSFDVNDEKGEIGIIKDISFTVGDGKFVVITGPNGGGKSTTAKLIMGIERPTGGRILFDGQDITDMSITDRANLGISFAFQQPVRFKGVQVIDLLRLAARKKLTVSEACQYLAVRSTPACPAVSSRESRLPLSLPGLPSFPYLTSLRQALICGVSRT